jgi:hypothetical protein
MRADVCGGCRFWQAKSEAEEMGECRRHPPAIQVIPVRSLTGQVDVRPASAFPPSHATSWCGDFAEGDHGDGEA